MKKIIMFLFAASLPLLLAGCASKAPVSGQKTVPAPLSAASSAEAIKPIIMSSSVDIRNFSFSPAAMTVPAGTIITWINNDSAPHQIKSDVFNSDVLAAGQSFSYVFKTPGTFDYYCSIHPSMKGQIIVQ